MQKKYLIVPGYLVSKNDGDVHYICVRSLMDLYNVSPAECVVLTGRELEELQETGAVRNKKQYIDSLLHLTPRFDGDYDLTKVKKEQKEIREWKQNLK